MVIVKLCVSYRIHYIGYDKWLQEEMALPILVVREYDSSMIQYVQIIQLKKRKK